ncbi:hypothetical protein R6Q57_025899 [Mikania cordata]
MPLPAQPHPHTFGDYEFGPSNVVGTSFSNPVVGMVGETISRSSDSGFFAGNHNRFWLGSGPASPRPVVLEKRHPKTLESPIVAAVEHPKYKP